ncbi:MAG: DNA cytosine methyltransferase [Clostridia bacterium]|nr:DNA cytosine methyltransferase [Clostridia bacterium]
MRDKNQLSLGSLFDGSGGFPLGGIISGITPVWASEIEPFPIRVTTKRLPFMKHYGDISKLNGAELEPVDIVTFGSPCQDMSVAGKRAGLDGSRSNLFYEAVRIVREMRETTNGEKPRYIVWENVPGAFSSNGGEDFKAVLDTIRRVKDPKADTPRPAKWPNAGYIMADDYSIAWRVLDAQYWGVPQRRKRIYLVADFAGGSAGKILFESESLSGYSAKGFRPRQGTAGAVEESAHPAGIGTDGYNGAVDTAAATLGANCGMSTGRNGVVVLNDQGGKRMDITEDVTCTLRAEAHHPPVITEAAGFCTEHSAKSRSIGYDEETSPTLRAGAVPAAVALENHPADSRVTVSDDGKTQTLTLRMGTGGNNVPLVMKIRCGCEGGGKGPLVQTNKSATLATNNDQTVFVPTVFGICSNGSNAMKSSNSHSGVYEADTSRTIDGNGGNPSCNQGGMAVVAVEGNGARPSHNGSGYSEDNVSFTLNATEQHGIAYGLDRASYNQGKNAQYDFSIEEDKIGPQIARGPGAVAHPVYSTSKSSYHTEVEEDVANTLVATDYKDPPTISEEPYYVVRRLTPTECARLQGFPDWWCSDLSTEDPSPDEISFWRDVFETHRSVTGSASKPKTDAQIAKWLKDPCSDSAEYKMWGNGVALPCVCFVLAGIEYYNRSI